MIAAHPSSWSSRKQRDHAAAMGRGRWMTADPDLARQIDAAVDAVAEAMPHLPKDAILEPPHAWFDAALARQMAIAVLVDEFLVARRVVAAVSLMTREAVLRGMRVIAQRSETEEFAAAMYRVRSRAAQLAKKRDA